MFWLLQVTPPGGVEFSGEGGEMTALWTISCPKTVEGLKGSGGVDIKVGDDLECGCE